MKLVIVALALAAFACTRDEPKSTELTSVALVDGGAEAHATPVLGDQPPPLPRADGGAPHPTRNTTEWTPNGPRVRPAEDVHDMGMHHPPEGAPFGRDGGK